MLFMSFTLDSQLHLIKSFKFCSIVSFDNLYNKFLDFKYHAPKRQLDGYFKLQTACLYDKYFRNLMITPAKLMSKERTFSL